MLSTNADYVRPTASRPFCPFTQKEFPEIRRDKFTPGQILSKSEFADESTQRMPQLASVDYEAAELLEDDLKIAIETITDLGPRIRKARAAKLAELAEIAAALEPLRSELNKHKSHTAAAIAKPFNVAFTAAIIDAMKWPDVELPVRYLKGFPVIGDIPDSGVFRADVQPAETPLDEFMAQNTVMVKAISERIEKQAKRTDPESVERRQACWQRTSEEIHEKLVAEPRSRAQMDRKYGRGKWRCLGRSAIKQKGKWRCIDDGKRGRHNKATTMRERITCGSSDFPAMIARRFAQAAARSRGIAKKRSLQMRHGTDDLRAAYRHAPTSQPQFTCVAVWHTGRKQVVYCDVPGHNFGHKSAPCNFCRFPELASIAARRLLWVVNEHYVDDNDTCEPEFCKDSGQQALISLCSEQFFGFPFDETKHTEMEPSNEYLGVVTDLSRAHENVLQVSVTSKRRKKIRDIIDEIIAADKLASGIASSLFGKAGFMLTPNFGGLGRACLQPIMTRAHERRSDITPDLADSLEFIQFVTHALPPIQIPLVPSQRDKVVIFTDAEGKARHGTTAPAGHLGIVVIHPIFGRRYAYAKAPDAWVDLFDKTRERATYIFQYELAAALAAFTSLPAEWLHDRPVEMWIDNTGAIGALIKDYSGVADCARIVNMFHFAAAKLGIQSLWIDYVPSESNPADVPSRLHEMSPAQAREELKHFGTPIELVLPQFADNQGEWLSYKEIASSIWN